jgi:hypothetical protein
MFLDVSIPCAVLLTLDCHNYHTWDIELQTLFKAKDLCSTVAGDTLVIVEVINSDRRVQLTKLPDAELE